MSFSKENCLKIPDSKLQKSTKKINHNHMHLGCKTEPHVAHNKEFHEVKFGDHRPIIFKMFPFIVIE